MYSLYNRILHGEEEEETNDNSVDPVNDHILKSYYTDKELLRSAQEKKEKRKNENKKEKREEKLLKKTNLGKVELQRKEERAEEIDVDEDENLIECFSEEENKAENPQDKEDAEFDEEYDLEGEDEGDLEGEEEEDDMEGEEEEEDESYNEDDLYAEDDNLIASPLKAGDLGEEELEDEEYLDVMKGLDGKFYYVDPETNEKIVLDMDMFDNYEEIEMDDETKTNTKKNTGPVFSNRKRKRQNETLKFPVRQYSGKKIKIQTHRNEKKRS